MIVSEIYFHVGVARGVFSYKYLHFGIHWFLLDIPLAYFLLLIAFEKYDFSSFS